MNGFIRYAHNLTPYRILPSFLRWKYGSRESVGQWTKSRSGALDLLPDENTREQLQKFHSRAMDLVLGQILLSPGVLTICMPLVPIFVLIVVVHTQ